MKKTIKKTVKKTATARTAKDKATAPATGVKVEPWRDWARRLCVKAGLLYGPFEEAEASGAPGELRCSMFYEGAKLAFRDFAPEVAEAGLTELLGEVEREREAMRRDSTPHEAWARLALAVNRFPQTLRRIAESPAAAVAPLREDASAIAARVAALLSPGPRAQVFTPPPSSSPSEPEPGHSKPACVKWYQDYESIAFANGDEYGVTSRGIWKDVLFALLAPDDPEGWAKLDEGWEDGFKGSGVKPHLKELKRKHIESEAKAKHTQGTHRFRLV